MCEGVRAYLEQKGSQPTSWHWASRSVRFGRLRPYCEVISLSYSLGVMMLPHRLRCRLLARSKVSLDHIDSPTGKRFDRPTTISFYVFSETHSIRKFWTGGKTRRWICVHFSGCHAQPCELVTPDRVKCRQHVSKMVPFFTYHCSPVHLYSQWCLSLRLYWTPNHRKQRSWWV